MMWGGTDRADYEKNPARFRSLDYVRLSTYNMQALTIAGPSDMDTFAAS